MDPNPIAAFGLLTSVQEAHRNPATLVTLPMVLDLARGGKRGQGRVSLEEAISLFPMFPKNAVPENRALNEYLQSYRQAKEQGLPQPKIPAAAERARDSEAALYDAWLKTRSIDAKKLNTPQEAQAKFARHMQNTANDIWGKE
jgi:hypothetical protein